jgi:hypothetical protein
MEPDDPLRVKKLLQLISSSAPKSSRSWIGSIIVILAAVFSLLTPNEGHPAVYQRVVDSLFHNWFAMTAVTAMLWLARRSIFGSLPRLIRVLTGPLLAFFLLVSMLDFVLWRPLWAALKPFGVVEVDAVPIVVMGVFAVWGIGIAVSVVRGAFRWFRRRYEHHGVAVGLGPLYFYFRRRRAS